MKSNEQQYKFIEMSRKRKYYTLFIHNILYYLIITLKLVLLTILVI